MEGRRVVVLYDGKCYICSYEVMNYCRRNPKIEALDISTPEFDASQFGLDAKEVQRKLHVLVMDENGDNKEVFVGIDSFIAIWKSLDGPIWGLAAWAAQKPLIKPPLQVAYHVFAEYIRPALPKRKNSAECKNGTCEHA